MRPEDEQEIVSFPTQGSDTKYKFTEKEETTRHTRSPRLGIQEVGTYAPWIGVPNLIYRKLIYKNFYVESLS